MVDAHAQVLVEVARAVVVPGEAPGLRADRSVAIREAPIEKRGELGALLWRDVRAAVDGLLVPDIDGRWGDVHVATDYQRVVRRRFLRQPAQQALVPVELAREERRAHDTPVGRVQAHEAYATDHGTDHARLVEGVEVLFSEV